RLDQHPGPVHVRQAVSVDRAGIGDADALQRHIIARHACARSLGDLHDARASQHLHRPAHSLTAHHQHRNELALAGKLIPHLQDAGGDQGQDLVPNLLLGRLLLNRLAERRDRNRFDFVGCHGEASAAVPLAYKSPASASMPAKVPATPLFIHVPAPPCSLESCTSPPGTLMPVTAEDIAAYLDAQDDFDLELFVHRSLVRSGFRSEHAGTYSDPASGRPQRFDVRARRFFPGSRRQLLLAVECQSLSAQSPLLVSRVPRSVQERYHGVVRSWQAQETGEDAIEVLRWERGLELYPENVQVGRKLARIPNGSGAAGESPQEQWSRALMSAAELVREANRAS